MTIKKTSHLIAAAIAFNFILISGASAATTGNGTVNAVVDAINTLEVGTFQTDITGEANANAGITEVTIASGVINNNYQNGWNLTVLSGNNGKLIRGTVVDGDGDSVKNEIAYNDIIWEKVSGTLGAALTDPDTTSQAITTGTAVFETGAIATPATTATVDYAYNLNITWGADTSLLQGTYADTITMTLAVNVD